MEELKPCPFCGGTNIQLSEGTTFRWRYVGCAECGAQLEFRSDNRFEPTSETWADAATEWNRRALPTRGEGDWGDASLDEFIKVARTFSDEHCINSLIAELRRAYHAAQSLRSREGWKMVPRNPTEKMHAAASREWDGRMSARSAGVWQAMYDAAPREDGHE